MQGGREFEWDVGGVKGNTWMVGAHTSCWAEIEISKEADDVATTPGGLRSPGG